MAIEEIEKPAESAGADGTAETAAASGGNRYPVAPGYRVNVRSGPSTTSRLVRVLGYGAHVVISCQRRGQRVSGPYGSSDIWDKIGPGQYVADAYVKTGHDGYVAPRCS
ncbi:hypothetical protein ABZW18_17060 [Streptomyces sp. NPDC004647]|uniref:hypothetical protein n=1 Tax=Streptomyces sp. NPDC004647 TaxID=3154671 RepID=UPI0033BD972B